MGCGSVVEGDAFAAAPSVVGVASADLASPLVLVVSRLPFLLSTPPGLGVSTSVYWLSLDGCLVTVRWGGRLGVRRFVFGGAIGLLVVGFGGGMAMIG